MYLQMSTLLEQLKKQRLALGLKQKDMMLRVGISRQQYQQLESKGNPRLNTLELVAKGLNCELMLIPKDKAGAVKAALDDTQVASLSASQKEKEDKSLADDPWKGLLEDEQ